MREMPDLGTPLGIRCLELPEIEGGWAIISPELGTCPPLISEFCDSRHACLLFGEVDATGNAAKHVRDAFVQGGVGAVTKLGGMFSAIVVERLESRLHALTTAPGCRSLRSHFAGGALCLAPTDLGVVALSRCDVQPDIGALVTLVASGWPLGGGTGLKNVKECQAHEAWSWASGTVSVASANPLHRGARLEARDTAGIASKIDETIDELRLGIKHQLSYNRDETLSVPLTAGVDSRAVLALVLSLVNRERVATYTRGTSSQDVSVARHLSKRIGIPHESRPSELPSVTAFADNARFLAVVTNGISNAHAAVGPQLRVRHSPPAPLGGGGEVFRGFYYKYLRRQKGLVVGAGGVAKALLAAPLRDLRTMRFASPGLDAEPARRLRAALDTLEPFSQDVYDLADLFYVFERMGRWGSTAWRPSLGPSFVPFANHRAMAAAFQLPAPIGDHKIVAHIIARFMPRSSYWTPVNGAGLLVLEGRGRTRHALREVLRLSAKIVRETRQRWLPNERAPKQVRLEYMTRNFGELLNDTLRSSGSLAHQLLTAEQLEALLDGRSAHPNAFTMTGALFSLDLWKAALDRMGAAR